MKFLNNKKIKNIQSLRLISRFKKEFPFFILHLKSDLIKSKLNLSFFLKKIPTKTIHQLLFVLFVNSHNFGRNLSYSFYKNKKFVYPLPTKFLDIISKKIKVNYFLSTILFFYSMINHLIKGYVKNLIIIFCFKKKNYKEIVYFPEIPSNLALITEPPNLNFFNNFKKIINFDQKVIIHNNPNLDFFSFNKNNVNREKFCKNYMFINNNIFYKIYFFLYSTLFCLLSFILIFFNRYQYALLYDDLIKLLFVKNQKNLNVVCFFNSGSSIHRPLWTYKQFIPSLDSYFFVYSINTQAFIMPRDMKIKDPNTHNTYSLLSWDNYLTCCTELTELMKKSLDNYSYSIQNIKNFSFEGNKKFSIIKKVNELVVSIFDVPAYRPRLILYDQNPYCYYNYKNSVKFYYDTLKVLENSSQKWKIFIKQKRPNQVMKLPKDLEYFKNSRFFGRKYSGQEKKLMKFTKLSILESNRNIQKIEDDNINSNSLILESDLVISMPYTTPSSIANEYGVKTFFYDPSGLLPEHILTKNIPLISDQNTMNEFINKNF